MMSGNQNKRWRDDSGRSREDQRCQRQKSVEKNKHRSGSSRNRNFSLNRESEFESDVSIETFKSPERKQPAIATKPKFIKVSTEIKTKCVVDRDDPDWNNMYLSFTQQLQEDGTMVELGPISFYLADAATLVVKTGEKRKQAQIECLRKVLQTPKGTQGTQSQVKDRLWASTVTASKESQYVADAESDAPSRKSSAAWQENTEVIITPKSVLSKVTKVFTNTNVLLRDENVTDFRNFSTTVPPKYSQIPSAAMSTLKGTEIEEDTIDYNESEYKDFKQQNDGQGEEDYTFETEGPDLGPQDNPSAALTKSRKVDQMFSHFPTIHPNQELKEFPIEYRASIFDQNFYNTRRYNSSNYFLLEPLLGYKPNINLDWGQRGKSLEVCDSECPQANKPRCTWIIGDSQVSRIAANSNFVWMSCYPGRYSYKFRKNLNHYRNAAELDNIVLMVGASDALNMIDKISLETMFSSNVFNLIADLRARGFRGRIIFPTVPENLLGAYRLNNAIREHFEAGNMLGAEILEFNDALNKRKTGVNINDYIGHDRIHISYEGGYEFAWQLAKIGVYINERIRDAFLVSANKKRQ